MGPGPLPASLPCYSQRGARLPLPFPVYPDCSDIGLWQHRTLLHYGTDILANSSFQSDPRGKADHTLCPAFKETWKISCAPGRVKEEREGREERKQEGEGRCGSRLHKD